MNTTALDEAHDALLEVHDHLSRALKEAPLQHTGRLDSLAERSRYLLIELREVRREVQRTLDATTAL